MEIRKAQTAVAQGIKVRGRGAGRAVSFLVFGYWRKGRTGRTPHVVKVIKFVDIELAVLTTKEIGKLQKAGASQQQIMHEIRQLLPRRKAWLELEVLLHDKRQKFLGVVGHWDSRKDGELTLERAEMVLLSRGMSA